MAKFWKVKLKSCESESSKLHAAFVHKVTLKITGPDYSKISRQCCTGCSNRSYHGYGFDADIAFLIVLVIF